MLNFDEDDKSVMFLLNGAIGRLQSSLLPAGGAKAREMEALTFLSELELQQKQTSFFCSCLVVFYNCYDLMKAKKKSHHD